MPKSSENRADGEAQDRSGLSESRRRELADFLRTRREKLKPEQLGITQLSRRRTPGLRREEVAESRVSVRRGTRGSSKLATFSLLPMF